MISEKNCVNITGFTKDQFKELLTLLPSLKTKKFKPSVMLAIYLFRMKNNIPLKLISTIFGILSFQMAGRIVNETRDCLNKDLVMKRLDLNNMNREDLINDHTTYISKTIFESPDNLITIWGRTYAYCQKSSNYFMQKKMYSGQKKRHLVKPFIGITTDVYYLDVFEPYDASSNDASIMSDLLHKTSFRSFFEKDDIFVLDRGFRDA